MLDDELLNESEQAQGNATSPTSPSGQSVTPQAQGLSPEQVASIRDQVRAELSQEFRAQLANVANQGKSVADRKRNEALRAAKVLEQNADVLGYDADALKEAKRKVIEKAFYDESEPEQTIPQPQAQYQAPRQTAVSVEQAVSATVRALKDYGISPKSEEGRAILAEFGQEIELPTPEAAQQHNVKLTRALSKALDAKEARQSREQQAQGVQAGTVSQTGVAAGRSTGDLGRLAVQSGAPQSAEGLQNELQRMMDLDPPSNPVARREFERKMDDIAQRLKDMNVPGY